MLQRYLLNFIYLAQIKSNAPFRTESNYEEPPRILLHFVPLHFALLLCITFCVKSYYILRYGYYYILRRKLLHFALLSCFVAKVITFCVSYYNMWRNNHYLPLHYSLRLPQLHYFVSSALENDRRILASYLIMSYLIFLGLTDKYFV